jgi:hypothetical protein
MNIIESFEKLRKESDSNFDKAKMLLDQNIKFIKVPFDANMLEKISATKHVIYFIKVLDFGKLTNSEDFIKIFEKIKTDKKAKYKYPQINKDSNSRSEYLYVGKSSTNFATRLKQHFGTNSPSTYAIHYQSWNFDPTFKNFELELNYYQFDEKMFLDHTNELQKILLEIIESSLHKELKPILGRSGH